MLHLLRGWIGEKKTRFYMWLALPKSRYHTFHNIILPSRSGSAQIDHLVVSVYGIFLVETKNKRGWIFGDAAAARWTQCIYRRKYSFQNPLRQAFRQQKVLSEFLNIRESCIHPIVYFVGDCTFKTPLPGNVLRWGLNSYIKRFQHPILSAAEVYAIIETIHRFTLESPISRSAHVQSLRARLTSTTVCPRCGGQLVERRATKGPYVGRMFLGCENYPKCRAVVRFS
jgi:restriction system protein